MAGNLDIEVDLIKDGMNKYGIDHPIFEPGHRGPNFTDYVVFEGYSVTEDDEQKYIDSHVAYRRGALEAIEYLKKFGYTGEQAYMILGTVPVEGRQSGVVDIPSACSTIALPNAISDFDISPDSLGTGKGKGQVATIDDPLE